MPRLRIEKYYYRSGQLYVQNRYVNGEFHGCCRTWHFNGQLAGELRYRHGLLHGVSQEWDETGKLLGSFEMIHGTGVQQYWHDNGQLRMEITTRNGLFHGRNRSWLRDGTLIQEHYLIENRNVSRAVYLKEARKHSDWPQYDGEPAGRKARDTTALQRKQYELFIAAILEKSHAEAKCWLSGETRMEARSLARFRSAKAALRFVESLYTAGAEIVFAAPIYGSRRKSFADWLLIKLPTTRPKRRAVRTICSDFHDKRGGGMLPDKDFSETHLFLRLH